MVQQFFLVLSNQLFYFIVIWIEWGGVRRENSCFNKLTVIGYNTEVLFLFSDCSKTSVVQNSNIFVCYYPYLQSTN